MKVLYNWLKEFVDFHASPQELVMRLAMCGVPVESLEDSAAGPVLDLEIFSNRGDLLGHYGVAREIAAMFRTRAKPVNPKLKEVSEKAESATRVAIECPDLCGRFTARVIRGVTIKASPDWLKQRLEALGQQPINNVVDATNYVMLELGHPLHAFDLETLAGRRIVVRRARPGEKFRTLDGVERQLRPEMCMVCDAERAGGIGGVMGGAETEISPYTKSVLLECAWFDPISIRRTSKVLNLRTEASTRFERALDPEMAEVASRRCAELIQQVAGGEILAGLVDVYPARKGPEKIELTRKELLRVMGADVPDRDLEEILAALGFAPERSDHNRGVIGSLAATWQCTRPSWRHDVARETDVIEEVARHYGFDRFPSRLPAAKQPAARLPHAAAQDALCERLVALGYHEIVAIPLVDLERDAVFRPEGTTPAQMHNPLAEDASVLRSTGLINMVQALEWNINRGQQNVRLFEVGRKYELRNGKPVETPVLTLGATGLAREQSVHEPARKYSFADLKGELDALAELLGGFAWQPASTPWLHPARSASIASSGSAIGVGGQLAARAAERFKLRQDVWVAELLLEPLYQAWERTRASRQYRPLPRFPAVERDFSLVLADGTTFAQVAEVIRSLGVEEVESVAAVDLFRGGQVPKGKFSLLVRVVFQSHTATLTEAEISRFHSRIVGALEQKLGASLRTQ